MAPQPLSKVNPKATFRFGSGAFHTRQELAAQVMRLISIGSLIEFRWSLMLIKLLRADPHTGMAMYQALSSAEARRAALLAAAKTRLPLEDYQIFQCVAKVTAPQRKIRNEFAHHLWGESPELSDCLLLINPEYYIDNFIAAEILGTKSRRGGTIKQNPEIDKSLIQVYSKSAMEHANKSISDAMEIVSDLGGGLHHADGSAIDGILRQKLLNRPPISQALERLKKQSAH